MHGTINIKLGINVYLAWMVYHIAKIGVQISKSNVKEIHCKLK